MVKFCVAAALSVTLIARGQESVRRYDALKQALGLRDEQLSQLQEKRPVTLDDSQRAKLVEIRRVFDRWDAAAMTIEFGLIDQEQWPGGTLCDFYPIRAYAFTAELGLSDGQSRQLEELKETTRAAGAKPPHGAARTVLDEAQRAKLAAFEGELQLASEAIALGLIPRPARGEILCH